MSSRNDEYSIPPGLSLQIEREYSAPLGLVYEAWTRPEHLKHWWGPEGYEVISVELDLRQGGRYRVCIRSAEGQVYCMGGVYHEIAANARLVFGFAWEDAAGQPLPGTLVTVTFAESGGRTKVSFGQTGFPNEAVRDGHLGGWNSCFDRLGEHLKKLQEEKEPGPDPSDS